MTDNRFIQLLRGLKASNDKGAVRWQDLEDEDMFRAHVADGMVRIGKADHGDQRAYALWVLNGSGAVIGEVEIREGDEHFPLIEDVYMSARLLARNGRQVLDRMLRELQAAGPVGP